jgi:hypothetical protein
LSDLISHVFVFFLQGNQTKQLVYWLEITVIRHFPVEFRDNLKPEKQNWTKFFMQFLQEINCPIAWTEQPYFDSNEASVVNWLLSKGISLEYEDNRIFLCDFIFFIIIFFTLLYFTLFYFCVR